MPTRREALRFLGGSTAALVAATGFGAGAFVATREPKRAELPWRMAAEGNYDDPRLRALAYAVLAPNPHNKQPWLFDLVGEDGIDVYCELDRRLPVTDPFDRQITIGFGACLELLRMAAAEAGFRAVLTPFPDGEPQPRLDARPIARVRLRAGEGAADPLFAHARDRRTSRKPFETNRAVEGDALRRLRAAAGAPATVETANADPLRSALRDLSWRAHVAEANTAAAMQETVDVLRIGKAEINANPDGIALQGPMIEALHRAGAITAEAIGDPTSSAFRQGLDMFEPVFASAMAHVWITTETNTRADQFAVGRDWVRIHLAATAAGLSLQPMSQALQEYPEVADLYTEVHALLAPDGGRVQMLGRLGYGPKISPAPRWPLETRLAGA